MNAFLIGPSADGKTLYKYVSVHMGGSGEDQCLFIYLQQIMVYTLDYREAILHLQNNARNQAVQPRSMMKFTIMINILLRSTNNSAKLTN